MDGVREGDHVVVIGAVQVYEKGGSISFIIERLFSQGIGNLQAQYEQIKNELAAAGYFDSGHKREIPRFPWRVGVLTSKTGAVIHDIQKIRAERNPYIQIVLFPIPVQGMPAAAPLLRDGGTMVTLIKPQFEAGRENVGKGGIVRNEAVHYQVIRSVTDGIAEFGLTPLALTYSPIKGADGNIEYLLYLCKDGRNSNDITDDMIHQVVEESHR